MDEKGHFYEGNGANMVSFIHYACGAVGDFFYRRILGIEPIEAGYRRFRIRPIPGGMLDWAEGSLETKFGKTQVKWEISSGAFRLHAVVPEGTTCEIVLPNGERYEAEGGNSATVGCRMML